MKYYRLFVTLLFVYSQIEHAAGVCGTLCITFIFSPLYAITACFLLCCICCGPPFLIIQLISCIGKGKSDENNKADEEVGGDPIIPGRTYMDTSTSRCEQSNPDPPPTIDTELYNLES